MNDKPQLEKTHKSHSFTTTLEWTGERTWTARTPLCPEIPGGPPVVFGGSDDRWSPEALMLASVNTCHLSSFTGYAKRKGFEFVSYTSEIEGLLEFVDTTFRFTKMVIRPRLVVKSESDIETAKQYLSRAHELCFMGHSVIAEVTMEPEVVVG